MIWGLSLEPGLEYTTTSAEEVHLSLAAIESRTESGTAGSYSQLVLKTNGAEQLLCTLVHGTIFQQCLDLKLMAGEEVTFTVQGSFGVFITGYSYKSPASDTTTAGNEGSREKENVVLTKVSHIKVEPGCEGGHVSGPPAADNVNGPDGDSTSLHREHGVTKVSHIKVEPGCEGGHVSGPPAADTVNGRGDSTSLHGEHADEENMEESDEEEPVERTVQDDQADSDTELGHTRPSATTLPHAVISPRTAGSGGYVTRNKRSPARSRKSGGRSPARTPREVANKTSAQTLKGSAAPNLVGDRQPVPAGPRSLQMVAGKSSAQDDISGAPSMDQVAKRLAANHRESTAVPAARASPSLKQQQSQAPPPEDRFTCPLCSEVFPGKDSLLAHEQRHAQEGEMFSCRYCHMVFVQKGNRNIHERIHSAMRHNIRTAFKAQSAAAAAAESSSSKEAVNQEPPPPPTPAQVLEEVMQESRSDVSEVELPPTAPSPPVAPPQQQSAYVSKAHSSRDRIRSRPYPNYSGLGLRAQGEEEKNYKCQFCDKPFKRNYDRNRHERIHTGQKPYECAYCELAFSRREHCKKHEVTHLKTPGGQPPEDDMSESN